MGFRSEDSDGRKTGVWFRCQCGCPTCTRVCVKRPDGSDYATEFVVCVGCKLMYHWPNEIPAPHHSGGNPWTPPPGGLHPSASDPELMTRIEEAAERARKSRKRR